MDISTATPPATTSLDASMEAMKLLQETSAETMTMNANFQAEKMMTDTMNAMANGQVDSANKAINAATQSGKAIQY